ncbi:MAG: hypothetical protein V3575_06335 [Candidatus Absconditabacteria bacterium]
MALEQNNHLEQNNEESLLKNYKDKICDLENELDEFLKQLQNSKNPDDEDCNGKIGQGKKINYN